MKNIDSLMQMLPDNFTQTDRDLVMRAYRFAEKAHTGQERVSGDAYITHCLAVAGILADMKVQPVVVAAGLLHDVLEYTPAKLDDLKTEFGEEVASLVEGVTRLTNMPRVSRADQRPGEINGNNGQSSFAGESPTEGRRKWVDLTNENIRKTFIAMSDDIRIIIIKLADRLHNMRTLGYMPENKRKQIAQETMDIFTPLANRLGIWSIKWELEDLAFRNLQPEDYKQIAQHMSSRHSDREKEIEQIMGRLKEIMAQAGIQAELSGRPKHIYSIYRKMQEKNKPFNMVMDLRAVRLIVPRKEDCYAALGVIHSHWRPIPQEFDDYIAAPKDNLYQSLHTAVIYDDGKPLEVQIRTFEMHQSAEYGIAAHWRYKEKTAKRDDAYEQRLVWMRKLMEWRQEVEEAAELTDDKSDIFEDRVFVFTPKGDLIELPVGATPIDFAYHVHTEIGHRCRGAKVNGKLVSLDYTLKTGDQVSILTAKQGGPSRDWLNSNLGLVKTQRARAKIFQWFKRQDREINLTTGKTILEKELHRLGMADANLDQILQQFEYKTLDELYVAVGCGEISPGRVVNKLGELDKQQKDPLFTPKQIPSEKSGAVSVLGLKGLLTTMARCCNPMPGDEIVGFITRGRGATIHRHDCPNILRVTDRERIIKVTWGEKQLTFPVPIQVKAYDRQGLMADIVAVISQENINILNANLRSTQSFATVNLLLEIGNINQLSRILSRIENLPNVLEAYREKPG